MRRDTIAILTLIGLLGLFGAGQRAFAGKVGSIVGAILPDAVKDTMDVGGDVLSKGDEQNKRLERAERRLDDLDPKTEEIANSQQRTLEKLKEYRPGSP